MARPIRMALCHPDRRVKGNNLCNACWQQKWIKERDKTKNLAAVKKYHRKLKQETINAYGGKCSCCGETELSFLSIDHINNDGAEHRRELGTESSSVFYRWLRDHGYPQDKFQCLCMNCQFGKRINGTCPHQSDSVDDLGAIL